MSEFGTPFRSDFSIVWISVVQYSDIPCTVSVRKPDVRFSDFWEVVRLLNRPDFGSSGPFTLQRPDFECPVPNRPNRPKPVRNRFQTGLGPDLVPVFRPKPVPNRFGTGSELVLVDSDDLEPDIRNPDVVK